MEESLFSSLITGFPLAELPSNTAVLWENCLWSRSKLNVCDHALGHNPFIGFCDKTTKLDGM